MLRRWAKRWIKILDELTDIFRAVIKLGAAVVKIPKPGKLQRRAAVTVKREREDVLKKRLARYISSTFANEFL